MWANLLGIPLFVVIFLATDHYFTEWDFIGDRGAVDALGVCFGLVGYYVARGIDVFLNEKRDNPEAFISDRSLPEVFGQIKEVLTESSFGPFFWSLKTVDQEASRIVAVLNFTEQLGTPLNPMQAQRLVMLQILVDQVAEEEQKPLIESRPEAGKGVTSVKLQWLIDSPLNRNTVNRVQDGLTKTIKVSLGLAVPEEKRKPSPFEPPDWVFVLLILAACFAVNRMDRYTDIKAQREIQKKEQQAEEARQEAEREEARRKAAEAQAARDAYNRQMDEKFRQGRLEQQRRANELLQKQQQNQYQPQNNPFTQPLVQPGGSLFQSPFQPSESR